MVKDVKLKKSHHLGVLLVDEPLAVDTAAAVEMPPQTPTLEGGV